MDFKQFVELVNQMRQAQKEYFRARSTQALTRARCLEGQVDRATAALMHDEELKAIFGE